MRNTINNRNTWEVNEKGRRVENVILKGSNASED